MQRICVLALGGLDPGGGAGILADARAIHAAGAFACAVATIQTVQSTRGLRGVEPVDARIWVEQARVVLADQRVRAIKIGALGSEANVRAVTKLVSAHPRVPVVLDPVMLATRQSADPPKAGRRKWRRGRAQLLDEDALVAMRRELVPRASLITANVTEAEALTGVRVESVVDAHIAAKALVNAGARAALIKGGHLEGPRAIDVLVTRARAESFSRARVRTKKKLHGAGCTLASLIAGRIALGDDVFAATRWAKRVHHAAIADAWDVGGELRVLSARARGRWSRARCR